jgi:hypothetical protein
MQLLDSEQVERVCRCPEDGAQPLSPTDLTYACSVLMLDRATERGLQRLYGASRSGGRVTFLLKAIPPLISTP